MSKIVFYHAECVDGFTAAWAFYRTGQYTCIPLKYGKWDEVQKLIALEPTDEVYFVDVSIPPKDVEKLAERVAKITILDHHKTAFDAYSDFWAPVYADNIDTRFDLSKSGARLAWEYLFPEENPPRLVQYVEDRDLCKKALPQTEEINAYIGSIPYTFPAYDEMYRDFESLERIAMCERGGESILRARQKVIDEALHKAEPFELLGVNVLAVNYGVTHGLSELGHELAKRSRDGCGLIWNVEHDSVRVSLRGHDGRDVSKMALHFGGGGHPGAAGFRVPLARFLAEYNPATRRFLLT